METKDKSPGRATPKGWEKNQQKQEILQRHIITVQERLEELIILLYMVFRS
mgnify:CR=1 FL=1